MSDNPVVIKYGGSLLEDAASRQAFLKEVAALSKKEKVVLVHGGGKEISQAFERKGLPSTFKNGLRVTPSSEAMSLVETVLKEINERMVKELRAQGVLAQGFSGKHKKLMVAHAINEKELGLVGLPFDVKPDVLQSIVAQASLPVFYSVAADENDRALNINADDFAWKIAVSYPGQAKRLIFLTDSGGILQDGKRLSEIHGYQVQSLVDSGVITGGMIVKAFSCRDAILMGVPQVDIAKSIRFEKNVLQTEGTSFLKTKSERISHEH